MSVSERVLQGANEAVSALGRIGPVIIFINLLLSALAVLVAWGVYQSARRAIRAGVRHLPGHSSAEKQVRGSRTLRASGKLFTLVLDGCTFVVVLDIWGVSVPALFATGPAARAGAALLRAGVVLLIAVLAFESAGFLINHVLNRLAERSTNARRVAQLSSLSTLLGGVAQGSVVVAAALMLLGDIGVRIGPLLAGAGVVGIAVGFGAQTLVRDLLTGIFLVVEDIVAVGDVARIGASGGLVEEMTLRTIRLRDFDGTLHVIPYGEAQVVHNLTKTFSYYVFDLQVSYASDVDVALRIMSETGDALQHDPDMRDKILEPIEVVGVDGFGESGVALKARIKTRPLEQWTVGREYNRRIKSAFAAAGIEIPLRRVKVVLPQRSSHDGSQAALHEAAE